MIISFPLPPSLNHAFPTVTIGGKSRRITSSECKAWKAVAGPMILAQWKAAGSPVFSKHYALEYAMNLNHRSDIGNREKCATDLIVATIPAFPGDNWCDRIVIERDSSIDGCTVLVKQL